MIFISSSAFATTDTVGGTASGGAGVANPMCANLTASGSGTLSTLGGNLQACSGNYTLGIYNDTANHKPDILLTNTTPTACSGTGWKDLSAGGISIVQNNVYWLCGFGTSDSVKFYYDTSGYRYYRTGQSFPTFPSPFVPTNSPADTVTGNYRMTYCSANYTLNSTANNCYNSTHYAYNTTYKILE